MSLLRLVQDEITFKSGEVSAKRWFFGDDAAFHWKGRGRSNIHRWKVSCYWITVVDTQTQTNLTFYLYDTGINYVEQTFTAPIHVSHDFRCDISAMVEQFERLYQLLKFREEYKNHTIEIIVGNACPHTTKSHSLLDFNKSIRTKCLVDNIEYTDAKGNKNSELLLSN
jgi:hypothetical protein